MKINCVSPISFKGLINDSHCHIGHWFKGNQECWFGVENLDTFVKSPLTVTVQGKKQEDTIAYAFVSNLDAFHKNGTYKSEVEANKELLKAIEGRTQYLPLYACQPSLTQGTDVLGNVLKEQKDKFVGLKFHTDALRDDLKKSSVIENYLKYLKFAQEHNLPCLFHSQTITDGAQNYASVEDIHKLAQKFSDIPVVLGHCGGNSGVDNVINAIKSNDSKLYCDISWLDWKDGLPNSEHSNAMRVISELKKSKHLDRILFGTDAPLGCFGESLVGKVSEKQAYEMYISSLKTKIKDTFTDEGDEIIDKIFFKNADELFVKKSWVKQTTRENKEKIKEASKSMMSSKTGIIIAAGLVIAGAIVAYLNKEKPSSKNKFFNLYDNNNFRQ